MISHPITIFIIIKKKNKIYILIDIRYLMYRIINSRFVKRAGFKYINIPIRKLIKIKEKEDCINKIIKIDININRY